MKINEVLLENDSLSDIKVFDNGNSTIYRYTVYFPKADYHIVMSENPDVPRNAVYDKRHGVPEEDEHLGREIPIHHVTSGAKQKIIKELEGHKKAAFL